MRLWAQPWKPAAGGIRGRSTNVNDAERIATANLEAGGHWSARPSPVFKGYTDEAASIRLGLLDGFGFSLLPPPAAHVQAWHARPMPESVNARKVWGATCSSILTIRSQGDCGCCRAFSTAETLADRFCVAAQHWDQAEYGNLSLCLRGS